MHLPCGNALTTTPITYSHSYHLPPLLPLTTLLPPPRITPIHPPPAHNLYLCFAGYVNKYFASVVGFLLTLRPVLYNHNGMAEWSAAAIAAYYVQTRQVSAWPSLCCVCVAHQTSFCSWHCVCTHLGAHVQFLVVVQLLAVVQLVELLYAD